MTTGNIEVLRDKIIKGHITDVLFDLDGTLYSSKSGIEFQIPIKMVEKTATVLSISEEQAKVILRKYREEFKSSVLGLQKYYNIDPIKFYEMVYDDIDISPIKIYEGLKNVVENLSKNVRIHLLTNSNRTHAARVLLKLGIDTYFTNIFSVEHANFIRKPNVVAYQAALKSMNVKPEEVINIDDSFLNLEVAHNIGMFTILVSNGIANPPQFWEMHKKIFHDAPHYVTASSFNITKLLSEIC